MDMMETPKQIAIYGKGGIGKSTIAANISAALAEKDYKVMQIGCDPKTDSTINLLGGNFIPTVLDTVREDRHRQVVDASELVFQGFNGVLCVEAGGPDPGVGCGGRGIITAVNLLKQQGVFEKFHLDVILYDVLGDVVCGGFAMPIREGVAQQVYVVISADFMALYAANNIFKGILKYTQSGGGRLFGLIVNSIDSPLQRAIVDDFTKRTNTRVIEYLPRTITVTQSELQAKTVIEANPNTEMANLYRYSSSSKRFSTL